MLLLYILRWLANIYDFSFKWTATAGVGIHPTKAWLSQLVNFKNAIWTWGHFRRTIFCFKLRKNDAIKTYGMHEWHKRFKEGRESERWLAKELGLGLLYWGFKGVQEEIPSEEVSTLQIGPMTFPPGQCTSSQLHPCHRLFDQDGHQDSPSASL